MNINQFWKKTSEIPKRIKHEYRSNYAVFSLEYTPIIRNSIKGKINLICSSALWPQEFIVEPDGTLIITDANYLSILYENGDYPKCVSGILKGNELHLNWNVPVTFQFVEIEYEYDDSDIYHRIKLAKETLEEVLKTFEVHSEEKSEILNWVYPDSWHGNKENFPDEEWNLHKPAEESQCQ